MKIQVDGQTVFRLRPGETRRIELWAGASEVTAKLDWVTSEAVPIDFDQARIKLEAASMPDISFSLASHFKESILDGKVAIRLHRI